MGKAIVIDAKNKEIREIETSEFGLNFLYKTIGCDLVELVDIGNNQDLWVDEEGLLRADPSNFFIYNGFPQPLAGTGVILGHDDNGDSTETKLTLDEVKAKVRFVDPHEAYRYSMSLDGGY